MIVTATPVSPKCQRNKESWLPSVPDSAPEEDLTKIYYICIMADSRYKKPWKTATYLSSTVLWQSLFTWLDKCHSEKCIWNNLQMEVWSNDFKVPGHFYHNNLQTLFDQQYLDSNKGSNKLPSNIQRQSSVNMWTEIWSPA